jgi:redox-sensing transcriptional repressor
VLVQHVDQLPRICRDQSIRIGVIAVPPHAAQAVATTMADCGIQVILNYTPAIVDVPAGVTLHNTDPVLELLHTLYYLSDSDGIAPGKR